MRLRCKDGVLDKDFVFRFSHAKQQSTPIKLSSQAKAIDCLWYLCLVFRRFKKVRNAIGRKSWQTTPLIILGDIAWCNFLLLTVVASTCLLQLFTVRYKDDNLYSAPLIIQLISFIKIGEFFSKIYVVYLFCGTIRPDQFTPKEFTSCEYGLGNSKWL